MVWRMWSRVSYMGGIAAGDEGDLVAIAVVVGGEQLARFLILRARILEREPADGPRHFAVGAAAREALATGANALGAIVGNLVFADGAGGGDFNLVHADDGDVGEESAGELRDGC